MFEHDFGLIIFVFLKKYYIPLNLYVTYYKLIY